MASWCTCGGIYSCVSCQLQVNLTLSGSQRWLIIYIEQNRLKMLENDSLCKYIPNLYIWFFSCKNSFQCFLLFFLLVRMQNICQTGGLRLTHGEPSWSQHASMNVKNKESWCETELRIIRPDPDCVGPEQTQTEREHPPWQQHDAPLIHWAMFEIFVSKYHRAEQAAHSDVCDPLNTFLNRS